MKVLYVRNLLLSTTEETIEATFSKFGEVERVKKLKDYCFVHFKNREEAKTALKDLNGEWESHQYFRRASVPNWY